MNTLATKKIIFSFGAFFLFITPSFVAHAADNRPTCIKISNCSISPSRPMCDCTQRLITDNQPCNADEQRTTIDSVRALCNVTNLTGTSLPESVGRPPQLNEFVPQLQIPLVPDFKFSKILIKDEEAGSETTTYAYIPYMAEYFAMLYKYAIGFAGLLAGIMITIAGFEWLTAAGDAGKIKNAKTRISNALIGLILALGSYTVLYLINPDLVSFKNIKVKLVQEEPLTLDDSPDELEEGVVAIDQQISVPRGSGCNKSGIQSAAEDLVNRPTCIGPNHCVWFVNRALNLAGCSVNQSNVAHGPSLKTALTSSGWIQNSGNLKDSLDKMKNVAVIRRSAHYALVVRVGPGNRTSDFMCYESNYTKPAQQLMRKFGGANCTINSRGTECQACERYQFEGPSPDTSGGYWARKYTRRYGATGPNQAFIKGLGLCGTSDEFFVLNEN